MILALQYWQYSSGKTGWSQGQVVGTAVLTAAGITIVFAPFMHWMDKLSYNRWVKRTGRTGS